MRRRGRNAAAVLGGLLVLATAQAQQGQRLPQIGYLYPAGGQVGTTFEIEVGGQNLNGVTNAWVTGKGVQATIVPQEPIINPRQAQELRDQVQELQNQKRTGENMKELAEIRRKLQLFQAQRRRPPALADTVIVRVTIAPDADPVERELRLGTGNALSNPLLFQIGQLPEVRETAKPAETEPRPRRENEPARGGAGLQAITIPATVNGRILPGDVDRFRFPAKKGQQLVVIASARALIPYIADAVPGWFQAVLALYDAKGNEVAYDDDYRFNPDPVLFYRIPADGDYTLEIRDSIYRGREDFVYRVALGELPFITSIFPLGGRAGTATTVQLAGWNLPLTRLTLNAAAKPPGSYPMSVRNQQWISNPVTFAIDTLAECSEKETNDTVATAQPLPGAMIVNGRIQTPGDRDVFRIETQAGETIVVEVFARRLGSPLDSVVRVTDEAGKVLAANDDYEDKGSGLATHHADSYLTCTAPATGAYFVHLADTQRHGGPEYSYRLRISAPRPDFALRVVPSSLSLRGPGSVPVTVFALRRDGFTNAIAVALRDAPKGFQLTGGTIPAGQDQVKCTIAGPATGNKEPVELHLEGRATIKGETVTRQAVPAEDLMQAFIYRHLVPSQELLVFASGRVQARAPELRVLSPLPVKIPAGGTATVRINVPQTTVAGKPEFELKDAPEGITIKQVTGSPTATEIVLQSDAGKVKPGLRGNLLVTGFVMRQPPAEKDKAAPPPRRVPVGTLPAIAFEVVQP
jgi:hypothetical protein